MQQTQLIVCLSTDQMVIWSAWCDWDLQLEACAENLAVVIALQEWTWVPCSGL